MAKKLPTLRTAGWLSDITTLSTALMEYFISSDRSQSDIYIGHVSSLPYLIRQYGNNPSLLVDNVEITLRNYFSRYFESVICSISHNDPYGDGRYNIDIDIMIGDGTSKYRLQRIMSVAESELLDITVI